MCSGSGSAWVEHPVTIDALSTAAQRLVRHGLARVVNGKVAITDPALAKAVGAADDPEYYLRLIAEVLDATRHLTDGLAAQTVAALQAGAHSGPVHAQAQDLVKQVVGGRLRAALEHRLAMPEVTSRKPAAPSPTPGWLPGRRRTAGPATPG